IEHIIVSIILPSSNIIRIALANPTINAPNVSDLAPSINESNILLIGSFAINPATIPIIKNEAVNSVINQSHLKTPYILKARSEEHTSELQSRFDLVCRLLLEKKNDIHIP